MVRQDLINLLTKEFGGITKRDMLTVVESFFESMAHALSQGETVEVRGLGRFQVKERRPVTGRNPKTNAPVHVPKRWVVRFRAAESLIARMNRLPASDHQKVTQIEFDL
jgi:integration host factor subunit beta